MEQLFKILKFFALFLVLIVGIGLPCWMIYLKEFVMLGGAIILDVYAFPEWFKEVKQLING